MRKNKHDPNQISIVDTLKLPLGHGGKRSGAGRKKGEPSVTMRIPESLVPTIREIILNHKKTKGNA